jgi:hypothetical protein
LLPKGKMTLGQLRAKLLEIGVRQVATMSRSDRGDGHPSHTFTFTADEKVVFPFGLKTTYFLTLDSKDDSTRVNSEKVKALIRAIKRDRESSEFDVTWFTT